MRTSERQRILIERLQTVGNRILRLTLPLRIEAIYVFGSILRAKDRPADLDLVVQYSSHDPLHDRFKELMKSAKELHRQQPGLYQTPKDALHATVLGTIDEKNWAVLEEWIEGYSWDMIYRNTYSFSFSWDALTKRVLLRRIPRVHISEFVERLEDLERRGHMAKAVEKVWSRDQPDVEANLARVLEPAHVSRNMLLELENFERQLAKTTLETRVAEALYRSLLPEPIEAVPERWSEFLKARAVELFPHEKKEALEYVVEDILGTPMKKVEVEPLKDQAAQYEQMSFESLQKQAEKKRNELKEATFDLQVMKSALRGLRSWKKRRLRGNGYTARYDLEDWIVLATLQDTGQKPVGEARTREMLRKLGLPEHRVLRARGRGERYILARSEAERKDVEQGNVRWQVEGKYRRELRPLVKQANRNLEMRLHMGQDLKLIAAEIWWFVAREGRSPGEVENDLAWFRKRGFQIDEDSGVSTARLLVRLDDCQGVEEMKARLLDILAGG